MRAEHEETVAVFVEGRGYCFIGGCKWLGWLYVGVINILDFHLYRFSVGRYVT